MQRWLVTEALENKLTLMCITRVSDSVGRDGLAREAYRGVSLVVIYSLVADLTKYMNDIVGPVLCAPK